MVVNSFTLVAGWRYDSTQVDRCRLVIWLLMHLLGVLGILWLLVLHLILLHEQGVIVRHLWLYHEVVCHSGVCWSI